MRHPVALLATALVTAAALSVPGAVAHPPSNPFDSTIFAPIQPGGFQVKLQSVATGLTAPLKGVLAPGEANRLYVVDQVGKVWAVDLATGSKTLFLDVGSRLVTLGVFGPGTFDERGLLGVAFHPSYAVNGKLYTYTSEPVSGPSTFPTTMPPGTPPDHQNVVTEWRAVSPGNPALGVNLASRRELLRDDHPQFNHNGGDLAFGPDNMLYVSDGDGGGADDEGVGHQPGGNAQKLNTPLGKVLRIDVDGSNSMNGQYGIPADNPFVDGPPGTVKEIFAFGFRNPFRFSFDSATGRLFVGDVGQNDIEEVDVVERGGNYGWATKEGTLFFFNNGSADGFASRVDNGLVPDGAIDPIAQYDTHHEGHSVIGGFVYHGASFPQLQGRYVFGDFARLFRFPGGPNDSGRLFWLTQKEPKSGLSEIQELYANNPIPPGQQNQNGTEGIGLALLGFGRDAAGELYALGNTNGTPFGTDGRVLRLAPLP